MQYDNNSCVYFPPSTVPDAPNTVIIPEYSAETRLLQRMLLNLTEPVSMHAT